MLQPGRDHFRGLPRPFHRWHTLPSVGDRPSPGTGEKLLTDAGSVSHRQALEKAEKEYRKYQVKTLSPVEEAYLDTLKQLEKTAKRKRQNEE